MKTIYNSINIMVDIETFGTTNNAPIVQIGAVKFNMIQGIHEEFCVNISYDTFKGYEPDYGSITFWLQQDKKVIESILEDTVSIKEALTKFNYFVGYEEFVWAKSTPFDISILGNAYRKEEIKQNYSFRRVPDMRDINIFFPNYPKQDHVKNKHNALSDARAQAQHVIKWMRWIQENK